MRDLHGSGRRRRREAGDDDVEAIGETLLCSLEKKPHRKETGIR
jgi:hypothetical protein